jgi:toxin YoeB
MRHVSFHPQALDQLYHWAEKDVKVFRKILNLLKEIQREPFKGTGKPEPLKRDFKGYWSRRITEEHRLVYKVTDDTITVIRCTGHYE